MPQRIGIFGGSFSPLHGGHLGVARSALRALRLDYLYFVPCGKSADAKRLLPARARWSALRRLLGDEPRFRLSRMELNRRGVARTVDTLRSFRRRFPQAQLFFLLGADQACALPKWKDADSLAGLAEFCVAPRRGSRVAPGLRRRFRLRMLHIPYFDISSTMLREST